MPLGEELGCRGLKAIRSKAWGVYFPTPILNPEASMPVTPNVDYPAPLHLLGMTGGVSEKKGSQYSTLNSRILNIVYSSDPQNTVPLIF